ncbi:hypothetical protein MPDQ_007480 [Monascus purpureus]|uniref:N-acetyltransferase domain-containing protein n=1 Tax=Monascus purpureus TaxID=5098 RepID=A0A507R6X6_MONPU|nr:hypothetical protein MPDQ_007480 [Monascus purpureus]BDD58834.1 hypothetical protein MAP00_004080 [Monascus purpureus]
MTKSQPTLRTARLELVPLGPEHRGLTIQLDTDPDVMKYIAFGKPFTHEQALEVHQWLLESATHVSGLGCWAGFAGGDFVGWWILAPASQAEFGFRLLPRFWRQGYAKEGAREMLRHAFQDLGLIEVIGETMTANAGSRAVMASCGLKHVSTFYNEYPTPPPGIEEGEMRYAITREEWLAPNSL